MLSSINTPDFIALYARSIPQKTAITELHSEQCWSYRELDHQIRQVASMLNKLGCEFGDRVVLLAKNNVSQVILHYACARLGLIYTPLNWRLSGSEVETLLERASPKLILCDDISYALLDKKHHFHKLDSFIQQSLELEPASDFSYELDRVSLMLFTSGTSGSPKGVMLTERNLNQSGANFSALNSVDRHSSFLCDAPLFHVMGMVANIRTVLQQGGHVFLTDGYDAERTYRWLCDESMGITHYTGVPQMIERFRTIKDFDPQQLENTILITGGAPHSMEDKKAWNNDGIILVSGSGMTEVGTICGMPLDRDLISSRLGSVGLLTPGMQARLVDNEGKDVAKGEAGELWLRGDSITPGYWQDQEKTESVFAEGRWFMTGDIVTIDADGYLWIVDRKKDMYISGGENVYPAEIEAIALAYPAVEEVAVVGVPDDQWGEVGYLAYVCKSGQEVNEPGLLETINQRLARYKVPKYATRLDSLPRTKSTGKVQKQELKNSLLDLLKSGQST